MIGDRLYRALAELSHAFVDMFVRPLKVLFPAEFEWWRWDNENGWVRDVKPAGYWIGHIVAYALVIAVVVYLAMQAEPREMF